MGSGWTNPWLETWGELTRLHWCYTFAWWPQRCKLSGTRIWMRKAYRGRRWITGPGDPAMLESWMTPQEFIMFQLTNLTP